MKIKEKEFTKQGKTYVSKALNYEEIQPDESSCKGCAFSPRTKKCWKLPPCNGSDREDGKDVIFVEKI